MSEPARNDSLFVVVLYFTLYFLRETEIVSEKLEITRKKIKTSND